MTADGQRTKDLSGGREADPLPRWGAEDPCRPLKNQNRQQNGWHALIPLSTIRGPPPPRDIKFHTRTDASKPVIWNTTLRHLCPSRSLCAFGALPFRKAYAKAICPPGQTESFGRQSYNKKRATSIDVALFGWGRRIRTFGMTESESVALPLGDTPIFSWRQQYLLYPKKGKSQPVFAFLFLFFLGINGGTKWLPLPFYSTGKTPRRLAERSLREKKVRVEVTSRSSRKPRSSF